MRCGSGKHFNQHVFPGKLAKNSLRAVVFKEKERAMRKKLVRRLMESEPARFEKNGFSPFRDSHEARADAEDGATVRLDTDTSDQDNGHHANAFKASNNVDRLEFLRIAITQMVSEAEHEAQDGTIAVEIPIKRGLLGRVKLLRVDFQKD
jgi:hypothetical protein